MIFDELAKKYGLNLNEPKPPVVIPPISAAQHQTVSETQSQIEQLIHHLDLLKKEE
jgi:hypothetical protein